MTLENQASSDRAGYRIPGADHRKWPCRSRSRAVVHLLRGWSGHLLEVNLAWTGSMPSLVVAAGRAKPEPRDWVLTFVGLAPGAADQRPALLWVQANGGYRDAV